MKLEDYAQRLAALLAAGDVRAIEQEIHAINLPEGWQEMVQPLFADLCGRDVQVKVIPCAEMSEYALRWLRMAPPEILARTPFAAHVYYNENSSEDGSGDGDTGSLDLALYQGDNGPRILMVGG